MIARVAKSKSFFSQAGPVRVPLGRFVLISIVDADIKMN